MATNLNKVRSKLPADFDFYPQTWVLPEELGEKRKGRREEASHVLIKCNKARRDELAEEELAEPSLNTHTHTHNSLSLSLSLSLRERAASGALSQHTHTHTQLSLSLSF
jgi:hypothetical protein